MSTALKQKIDSLSPEALAELDRFVSYLLFKSLGETVNLNDAEEAEIHERIKEMKAHPDNNLQAEKIFEGFKAKYAGH